MIKISLLPAPPRRAIPITLPALPWIGILFALLLVLVLGGIGSYWYTLGQEATRLTPTSWPCLAASAFSKGTLNCCAMAWV